jgi:thiol-disulfide isomerase/thioredoxin
MKVNFLLLFFSFLCVTSVISIKDIHELTDNNFNEIISSSSLDNDKWIVIFYLPSCPHCKVALDGIISLSKVIDMDADSTSNLRFGKVDCNSNTMACVSFDIKPVPTIVKLEKHRMIKFKSHPNTHELNQFIKADHMESETESIPEFLGYIYFIMKIIQEGLLIFNDYMDEKIKFLGFNFKWNIHYSLITLCSLLAVLILIEVLLIYVCCGKSDTKYHHPKRVVKNNQDIKEGESTPIIEESPENTQATKNEEEILGKGVEPEEGEKIHEELSAKEKKDQ